MPDALIFDIDGTLWNACPASAKGWNNGLKILGAKQRVTTKDIERVTGNPVEKCVEILLPELLQKYPQLLETLNTCEEPIIKKEGGNFYEGVLSGILKLSKHFPIFLISNCQEWYLNLFLEFSQLDKIFQDVDCHGMSHVGKDEMIKNMIKKHSLKRAVYIGDTAGDEEATRLAGIDFIHVSYGFGKTKGKPLSFSSFSMLVDYFQSSVGDKLHSNCDEVS